MVDKFNRVIVFTIILIFITSIPIDAGKDSKTIVIVLDQLDFKRVENIVDNYYGLGFLNIKGRTPSNEEGLFMSLSAGRKLRAGEDIYQGLAREGQALKLLNYDEFYLDVLEKNEQVEINLLGENLTTSYIGDDKTALLLADKEGRIDYGRDFIEYDSEWLIDSTRLALDNSDLLLLSYKIEEQEDREVILKNYINEFRGNNILVFPKQVSEDMTFLLNKNIVPVVYLKNGEKGILKSQSTRREGFITLEDINYEILTNYKIEKDHIGNRIEFIDEKNPIDSGRKIFIETFNLLLIAIVFQTMVYVNQGLTSIWIMWDRKFLNLAWLNKFIFINILVSLVLGILGWHRYLIFYLFINIIITYYLTNKIGKREKLLGELSTLIYFLMVLGIMIRPDLIYNSYFGFNNLFYGARYYGFNNGAMAIFLASSILSYFHLTDRLEDSRLGYLLTFLYFGLNMLILSAGKAANTGGFITSIVLFLTMIYINLLEDKSAFKKILFLSLVGILIFGLNMYFDSKSIEQSHAIGFIIRIRESGISEFLNMLKIKLKELIKYTLLPPFGIIMVLQALSLRKLLGQVEGDVVSVAKMMFFISLVAFIINDTGMIAFIFINQFNIANILTNLKYEDKTN